jgi:hypothetical protein
MKNIKTVFQLARQALLSTLKDKYHGENSQD